MARYQRYQRRYKGYNDLRDFLEDKHQRGEEPNSVPYDPPSLLRDPLRGDNPQSTRLPRNDFYRGRGRFQRRSTYNPNYTRPRGYNSPRGHLSRLPIHPTNIKIEFSTESGERKYQIETENDISDKFNTGDRGRGGNYRGRPGRYHHGRGRRGFYYRRSTTEQRTIPESSQNTQGIDQEGIKYEEEENCNLPVENNESSTQNKKDDVVLKEYEECNDKLEEYKDKDDTDYVEQEYLDEEEYYEGDEGQEENFDVPSELEEKEKVENADKDDKLEEKEEKCDEKKICSDLVEKNVVKTNLELKNDSNQLKCDSKDLKESQTAAKDSNESQDESKDSHEQQDASKNLNDAQDEFKDSKHDSKVSEISESKQETKPALNLSVESEHK